MMSVEKYKAQMIALICVSLAIIGVSLLMTIRPHDALQTAQATLAQLQVLEVTAIARIDNANATYEARGASVQAQAQALTTPFPDALLQTERGSFYATQERANQEWTSSVNATFEASWTLTPTPRPCRAENWLETSWDDEGRMFFVGIIPSLNGAEAADAVRAIPEVETFVFDPAGSFRDYERWVGTLRDDVTPSNVEARIVEALEIMCDEFIAQGAPECSPGIFLSNFDPDTGDFSIYHSAREYSIARAAADAVRAIPEVENLWNLYGEEGWLIENQWLGRLRDNYSASPEDVEQRIVDALDILCEEYR